MRAVNLLPKEQAARSLKLPGPWVFVAALAPIIALCVVYFGYSSAHSSVQQKQAELRVVNEQLAAAEAKSNEASAQSGLVGERSAWQSALQDALAKQMPWDVTLNDLAHVLPRDVWLTSLTATSPTPANVAAPPPIATTTGSTTSSTTTTTTTTTTATTPAANPTAFNIQGYAHSQNEVALVLSRLRLMPMLTDVTLGSTTQASTPAGGNVVQFQVTANIQQIPTGAAQ